MDKFSKTHPIFQFLFFGFVFIVTLAVYNPVFSTVSLAGAVIYEIMLQGRKAFLRLKFLLAIIFFVSIFNMLFAHYGVNVLFTLGDMEFTLEALFYGFNQGVVLSAVIVWFFAFSQVMESEKVVYVLRFMPKTALIFSMVLSFIPRFLKKLEDIKTAKLGLNGGEKPKNLKEKFKNGIDNFSSLVSYSLESSVITSNSMQARGYNPRAIRGSRYKIKVSDIILILLSAMAFAYVIYAKLSDKILFVFEPEIYMESFDLTALIGFCVLCLMPAIINCTEGVLWKLSSVKN